MLNESGPPSSRSCGPIEAGSSLYSLLAWEARANATEGGYVTSCAVCFVGIVSDVFLNYANGKDAYFNA